LIFSSVIVAGGARPIAVRSAERLPVEKPIARHNKNTDRQKKAKKPTDSRKDDEDCSDQKKPWMIHLQHPVWTVITSLKYCRLPCPVAVFVEKQVKLWIIFPGGGMATDKKAPIWCQSIVREDEMIKKKPLFRHRVRKIDGSFAWISHRFLRQGFWGSLSHHELLLYFFLVMAGDRQGISYYSFDKICSLVAITPDEYILARNSLIDKDLIGFDGRLFQVLSLPEEVTDSSSALVTAKDMEQHDPATIHRMITKSLDLAQEEK
jgi:hypothetical protein